MLSNQNDALNNYHEHGYIVLRHYFTPEEMSSLRDVILKFHERWKADHATFYREEAFNSSLITGSQYLDDTDRLTLFNFISGKKLMKVIETLIPSNPAFMNTQLFFNPVDPALKDFWHRDCQYDHDIEGQKKAVNETQVVHLRIPLFDELGIELVPGTHKRWDNEEEHNVRQEEQGRSSNDALAQGKTIPLAAGDVLVFSADMIHRGLYGLDRLALDILVFDPTGNFADYIDDDCLPPKSMLANIADPRLFQTSYRLKTDRRED
jgi:ectoine hydroxylase-related dioxygenase (phytanoyl-CoA dioxygenase family)